MLKMGGWMVKVSILSLLIDHFKAVVKVSKVWGL